MQFAEKTDYSSETKPAGLLRIPFGFPERWWDQGNQTIEKIIHMVRITGK